MKSRGFHEPLTRQAVGTLQLPSLPFRSANTQRWLRDPAPTLGEHNHDVLVNDLGLSEDEYQTLIAEHVIGRRPPT